MAITSKEKAVANLNRKEEYRQMREALIKIALASDTANADRIAAVKTIYQIDAEGVPTAYKW